MTTLARWLEARGAYRDVVAWAEPFGDDWSAAWTACPRGDWLLAIAATLETTDRRALVRAACACAELALEAVDDPSARDALTAARVWCDGAEAPDPTALEAAFAIPGDPAIQSAQAAALATLATIRDPREAPGAAAAAVHANALATGECALDAVLRYAHATTADRVRAFLPAPVAARG
ncbi:hypothetical protein [Sandaracinus amylolyticus]|uniref:Uncharacterized protein n=1 Tax=Sandaracinus amylolyticus TaxID=927083 RepID=A0A0F6WA72_9BACT|nr:hypothetical protein [Sandaracinus amylolyticus]AKF11290.1 hypothetical protein DB32_008439 [Sandaracinus amylolyticus]